jgi:hypothetical protein
MSWNKQGWESPGWANKGWGGGGGGGASYTISGTILDNWGDPVDGVTVTLTGDGADATVTAGGGLYSFSVANGSYTITPTLANYTFVETSEPVNVAGASVANVDFVGTMSSSAWISEGSGNALYYTSNFTMTNNQPVVVVSWWMKVSSIASDQGFFEFWNGISTTRYLCYYDTSAKSFRFGYVNSGGGSAEQVMDLTGFPAELVDGGGNLVTNTWFHIMWQLNATSTVYVNHNSVGTAAGGAAPSQAAISDMHVRVGDRRVVGSTPMTAGGGICQLRIHLGWTNRAAFFNDTPPKWQYPIDLMYEETELFMGWPFATTGEAYTVPAPTLVLGSGNFTALAGPGLKAR